ncbi:MAG: hypothetical protein Q4C70_04950 [Planctomycetia bacterium]|nr:hypothetical protein [Planctomycetia bacterium]
MKTHLMNIPILFIKWGWKNFLIIQDLFKIIDITLVFYLFLLGNKWESKTANLIGSTSNFKINAQLSLILAVGTNIDGTQIFYELFFKIAILLEFLRRGIYRKIII